MKLYAVVLGLVLFVSPMSTVLGQKLLRLDTPKRASKLTFRAGSPIFFQLATDTTTNKVWYAERLIDLDVDKQILIFSDWTVKMQDISRVSTGAYKAAALKNIGKTLQVFGVSAVVFATLGRLTKDCPNCNEATVVGLGSGVLGWLIDISLTQKSYKIGKNRLRMVDLTPQPLPPPNKA